MQIEEGRYFFLLILSARFCNSLPKKKHGSGLNVSFLRNASETFKGPVGDIVQLTTPTGEYVIDLEQKLFSDAEMEVQNNGGSLLGKDETEEITSVAKYLNSQGFLIAESVWAYAEDFREEGCQIIKFPGNGGYNIEKSDCDVHHATLYSLEPK